MQGIDVVEVAGDLLLVQQGSELAAIGRCGVEQGDALWRGACMDEAGDVCEEACQFLLYIWVGAQGSLLERVFGGCMCRKAKHVTKVCFWGRLTTGAGLVFCVAGGDLAVVWATWRCICLMIRKN